MRSRLNEEEHKNHNVLTKEEQDIREYIERLKLNRNHSLVRDHMLATSPYTTTTWHYACKHAIQ